MEFAAKKRLSITMVVSFLIEIFCKIIPLVILFIVQKRLGLASFGYAQFAIAFLELFIPFVVFGYNHYAVLALGQEQQRDPKRVGTLISNIITLKLLHAAGICTLIFIIVSSYEQYRPYFHIIMASSFILFMSALELQWLQIAIQKFFWFSWFNLIGKSLSLLCIIMLVHSPNDATLYTVLTFMANGIVCVCSTLFCLRIYKMYKPNLKDMLTIVKKSQLFAIIAILLIVIERIDIFMVESLFSLEGLGLYSGQARISHSFQQIMSAIVISFWSESIIIKTKEHLTNHLRLCFRIVIICLAPVIAGVYFVQNDIIQLLFGVPYAASTHVLDLLVLGVFPTVLIAILGLQVLQKEGLAHKMLLALIIGLICAIAISLLLVNHLQFVGISLGILIGKLIAAGLMLFYASPFVIRWPYAASLQALLPTLVMSCMLYYANNLEFYTKVLLGMVSYAIFLIIFNKKDCKKLYYFLISK